jgi:predicted ATPase/DNA-binding SARP family transcriptional activator/Tfp pilus assembly protein PilF
MWTIQVLGGLSAHSPRRQLTRFRTQKAASLLAYLAYHPAPQPRETLIALLWPEAEPEVGRHNLSNALSFLRHLLEPPGVPPGTIVLADRTSVRLNPAAVTVDAIEFENQVSQAQPQGLSAEERLARLLGAAERYGGTLLPGYYEEWVAPEALRLESLFVQTVIQIVPLLLAAEKREQALEYARRAVSADPLSEEATCCLMQAFCASDQAWQALRAYRQLERRLEEELDTQPSPALQRLAEQVRQSGAPRTFPAVCDGDLPAEETFTLEPASQTKAAPPEPVPDTTVVRSVSPARLLGGEFLLRTTTRFFGREEEVDRLEKMLSTPRTRLVTITGPGGTGKTRLALEVAAHLVEKTADISIGDTPASAVFIPLAPVTESERLFEVILRVFGLLPVSNLDPLDQLASALVSRPNTLLVLDNFEQLVEEGALRVHALLGKTAGVKLLVTSRKRLQIEEEHEFLLTPLPTSAGAQTLEALHQVPSIALFVDRAQAALPDFQLTERNISAVAQLCDYLEGLPLAIELAAARVALLTPARILEQVQADRLNFLATPRRDADSRQRTLRATLDWSYRLLPEVGQRFLAHLSVFRGGWTLEAAQAICALSEGETLDWLTLLRDSSLLQVTDTEEGIRFTLLETIREYGQEKLQEWGEDAAVRRRHRDWFLALAEEAEPQLQGAEQGNWLQRLETEHDNLRAALAWNETQAQEAEAGLRLTGALHRFWFVRGDVNEGRAYLGRALEREGAQEATKARAKALNAAGVLAWVQGDYPTSRTYCEESLALWRELGNRQGIAGVLNNLGNIAQAQGEHAAARTYYEEGLAINREIGNRAWEAINLNNLGIIAQAQGEYAAARTYYAESVVIKRELGDRLGVAYSSIGLGFAAMEQGEYAAAQAYFEESLTIQQEIGDRRGIAISLGYLGNVVQHQGEYAAARAYYEESLPILREIGDQKDIAGAFIDLAGLALDQGEYAAAQAYGEESLAINREIGNRAWEVISLNNLGNIARCQGEYAAARTLLEECQRLSRELGDRQGIASSLKSLGDVECDLGEAAAAQAYYVESLRLFEVLANRIGAAESLEGLAAVMLGRAEGEKAAHLWGASHALRERIGAPMPFHRRAKVDRQVEQARSALGEDAFAVAWEAGSVMTQAQAVACALE